MNNSILYVLHPIFIGVGATLTLDLWALFLKRTFKIMPPNFCLVGRWLRYMPKGIFKHSNIAAVPEKNAECAVGWLVHYMIGMMFAVVFLTLVSNNWLEHPTLIPALIFGAATVSAPFFIMQPAFGLGTAASKTPSPTQARMRSLMNHIVFGFGLYLFGLAARWLH